MPVHGLQIAEFPCTKEATDVKVQDQNNVDRLFNIRGIIHFQFAPEETTVNLTFYVVLKKAYC
jgi:hypothetical protein